MKSIKGPAIFLAQFAGSEPPFDNFATICGWAASLGYKGVQIPAWDPRFIDPEKAAESVGGLALYGKPRAYTYKDLTRKYSDPQTEGTRLALLNPAFLPAYSRRLLTGGTLP